MGITYRHAAHFNAAAAGFSSCAILSPNAAVTEDVSMMRFAAAFITIYASCSSRFHNELFIYNTGYARR